MAANDRPGILALVSSVLFFHGYDIHLAETSHSPEGVVWERFLVKYSLDEEPLISDADLKTELTEKLKGFLSNGDAIRGAMAEEMAKLLTSRATQRKAQDQTRVEAAQNGDATEVTIRTNDRRGLIFIIATALSNLGINLLKVKINTRGYHVEDILTVQKDGRPLDTDLQKTLTITLMKLLDRDNITTGDIAGLFVSSDNPDKAETTGQPASALS